jgi:hypothetical protein
VAPPRSEPSVTNWLDELPAITDDGATVAVANHVSLGARGKERLELDFIDVSTDRATRRVIVRDPDHPESDAGGEAKARALLAERTWLKFTGYEVEEDPSAPLRQGGLGAPFRNNRAAGEGLAVEYREPMLVVRDAATSAVMLRTASRAWSKSGGPRCPGCVDCPAPLATIAQAWGIRSRRVLLFAVGFRGGTDLCWEPSDEYHVVVTLPK